MVDDEAVTRHDGADVMETMRRSGRTGCKADNADDDGVRMASTVGKDALEK